LAARPAPLVHWRAVPTNELHFARWGDDAVLFHERSGLTHLVNSAAAVLLSKVLGSPRTLESAAEALASAQNAHADEHFLSEVAELIARLEMLGLVERVAA
jgi:PqqD family protein of HPr-rel-A system